jgi:hypothetical protein
MECQLKKLSGLAAKNVWLFFSKEKIGCCFFFLWITVSSYDWNHTILHICLNKKICVVTFLVWDLRAAAKNKAEDFRLPPVLF